MKYLVTPLASMAFALAAHAQITSIDFENPPYATGALSSGTFVANAPFTGQSGWSSSTSSGTGVIAATTTSGLYAGGQALRGGPNNADAYIGANNTFVWDLNTKTVTFDVMATFNEKAGIGGWTDKNNDGLFQQSEASAYGGIATNGQFTLRGRAIGADHLTGVAAAANNWYRVTLVYDDAAFKITMSAINLTTGGSVVDLDTGGAGTAFSFTFDSGTYDPVSGFDGLFARTTGAIYLDNIVAVPEPQICGSMVACGLGALALLRRRRTC